MMSPCFSSDMSSDLCSLDEGIVSHNMCNCGAEGRAHKDCPMNTQQCYPSWALLPPLESAIGSCPILKGESPTAQKRKAKMKVGERVCIHSGLFAFLAEL